MRFEPVAAMPAISQIAYVVDDIQAAMQHWAGVFGVGPFILLERIRFAELVFEGVASNPEVSLAFACRGPLEIELVQQHDDSPSVFLPLHAVWHGVHHVAVRSSDIVADEKKLVDAGMRRLQRGVSALGTITVFLDGGPKAGIVELIQSSDGGAFARKVRDASERWDGHSLIAR